MLPIVLDNAKQKYVLLGEGEEFSRRLALLEAAGCEVSINPNRIPAHSIVFIAGLPREKAELYYQAAQAVNALVNTEDIRDLCDFHMPAQVRRGDLLLTISTSGKAPGLARLLKEKLAEQFDEGWGEKLDQLAAERKVWQQEGQTLPELSTSTKNYVKDRKWI